MRVPAVLSAIILLAVSQSGRAQDTGDFLDVQGEKVPLNLSLNEVGILAREGIGSERIKDFAESRDYRISQELPGGLYILDVGREAERAALVRLPRVLKRDNQPLIAEAGLVATGPGLQHPLIITDEIIVQFKPEVSFEQIESLVAGQSASLGKASSYYPNQFIVLVNDSSTTDALRVSARFQLRRDVVDFAHPNFLTVVEPQEVIPNDGLFGEQWHHRNTGQAGGTEDADIDASRAWDLEDGAASTIIAIIDFGFDVTHPDLQPNLWPNIGWDFVDNDNDPSGPDIPSGSRHGTAGAGVAAAKGNNSAGVTGSCQNCNLMLVRISAASTPDTVGMAIGFAAHQGAAVITNSWAYPVTSSLVAALNSAATTGRGGLGSVIFLSMRNNHGDDCGATRLPSLDSVIAVNRSTNRDLFDDPASFGPCLDLLAPSAWLSTISSGKGTLWITTTDMTGAAGYNNNALLAACPEPVPPPADALDYTKCFIGTSSATPLAAGVAGLVLTADPSLTRLQVQRLLQDTADKIEDSVGAYASTNGYSAPASGSPTHGWGRINAYEAVLVVAPASQGGRGGSDVVLRDNRLDWGNSEQPSNTMFEAVRGWIPHWESMDIKVDAPPYQTAPTAASFEAFADETPSVNAGSINKVYVRVRNRGPRTVATATVKLHWAQFGTALPTLPPDFWSQFPGDSSDTSQWHPLNCAGTSSSTCEITNLAYSGSSLAGGIGDMAKIVEFDFPAPVMEQAISNHFCLLAMVDSPQDPISQMSKASFFVDGITPTDNNVTHRNYVNLRNVSFLEERVLVRNPFNRPLRTKLYVDAPAGWHVSTGRLSTGKPFDLDPLAEVSTIVTIGSVIRGGDVTLLQTDLGDKNEALIGGVTFRLRVEGN